MDIKGELAKNGKKEEALCKIPGHNFETLRKQKRLSQESIANELGTSVSHYRDIEHGKDNPTIHTIQKISEQLGAPPEKLFENSDDFTSLFSDLDLLSCLSEEDCALFDDFLNQLIHLILKNE